MTFLEHLAQPKAPRWAPQRVKEFEVVEQETVAVEKEIDKEETEKNMLMIAESHKW